MKNSNRTLGIIIVAFISAFAITGIIILGAQLTKKTEIVATVEPVKKVSCPIVTPIYIVLTPTPQPTASPTATLRRLVSPTAVQSPKPTQVK